MMKFGQIKGRSARGRRIACLALIGILFGASAHADCQPFLVESNNGDGGFRLMHDAKNFQTVASGTRYENVICDRRSFQVELAKKNPEARVRFSIDGKPYEFSEGDQGDRNVNSWYRKYIDITF